MNKALIAKVLRKNIYNAACDFARSEDEYNDDPVAAEIALNDLVEAVSAYHSLDEDDNQPQDGLSLIDKIIKNADTFDVTIDEKPAKKAKKNKKSKS